MKITNVKIYKRINLFGIGFDIRTFKFLYPYKIIDDRIVFDKPLGDNISIDYTYEN